MKPQYDLLLLCCRSIAAKRSASPKLEVAVASPANSRGKAAAVESSCCWQSHGNHRHPNPKVLLEVKG